MIRRTVSQIRERAEAQVAEATRLPPTRRKRPGRRKQSLVTAIDEVKDRFVGNKGGDWTNATASTWVGLYAMMHKSIYRVDADELADEYIAAVSSARRCFEKDFGGDVEKMARFIRWTWRRQAKSLKKNPDSDFRMGWRYQFSRKQVVDYRAWLCRD